MRRIQPSVQLSICSGPERVPMKPLLLLMVAAVLPAGAMAQVERLSHAETERAVYALHEWLESDHYDAAELTPLIRYGQTVVPSLVAALNKGPSPARRERLRRELETEYRSLAGPKVPPKAEFVRHYLGNFETLYRIRAAQALAAIGGVESRKAIEAAVSGAGREDLRAALQLALKGIR